MGEDRKDPVGVSYDGPSGISRDSMWLTNEDLVDGKDVTLKIEDVLRFPKVEFDKGRTKENALALRFAGRKRVLLVNATARKLLNKMFGSLVKNWKGQDVTLYVTECEAYGDTVKCIRLRNKRSRAATASEEFLSGDADDPGASPPAATGNGAEHATSGNGELGLGATPAGGSTDPKIQVTEACQNLGITVREQGMLYTKHGGDYAAMLAELKQRADDLAAKDEQESKVR